MQIVSFYKNYLFYVSFPLCASSALCVLSEADDTISQGQEEQAARQGMALHEPRQGSVLDDTSTICAGHTHHLVTVPIYRLSLLQQPSPLTFHTHRHMQIADSSVSYD